MSVDIFRPDGSCRRSGRTSSPPAEILTMRVFPQVILILLISGLPLQAVGDEPRIFEFSYEVVSDELPAGEAVDIYIPLPAEHADQLILEQSLQSRNDE